jgi:flagellar basal body-associated protein FliL
MVTPAQHHIIIIMGIIVLTALGSGLALFHFTANAAQKKTDELKLKLKESGKPNLDVAASVIL